MQNIYYSSDISLLFISDFTSIIDVQFNEYKKQIIQIIILIDQYLRSQIKNYNS